MELQVPCIDDPYFLYAVFISLAHLLPDFGQRRGIYPFIGNGLTVIVKMIVHPKAALMPAHLIRRQRTGLSEIILTEHKNHIRKLFPVF